MILVDTSVVIEFLRTGDSKLMAIFQQSNAAICGVTRAEVLHGIRSPSHEAALMAALNSFQQLAIPDSLWNDVGVHLAALAVERRDGSVRRRHHRDRGDASRP